MIQYYTEYPTGQFFASDDEEAKRIGKHAKVIYRETQSSEDGTPFVLIKVETHDPDKK